MKLNSPGCGCCCGVCWETNVGGVHTPCLCDSPASASAININTNIDDLPPCKLLLAGARSCGPGIVFADGLWADVKQWVESGGRLYVAGEYFPGCLSLAALDTTNAFLTYIGTSMQLGAQVCNCGCAHEGEPWIGIPAPVAIMDGLPGLFHACTNEVLGGTPIAYTEAEATEDCGMSFPFIAGERVGDGIVIVVGDSNIFTGCGFDNCEFFRRLRDNDINEIL